MVAILVLVQVQPVHAIQPNSPQHENITAPIQPAIASTPLALYSLFAMGGIFIPDFGLPHMSLQWHLENASINLNNYRVGYLQDDTGTWVRYAEIPVSTLTTLFEDVRNWIDTDLTFWQRVGNQINPPNTSDEVLGTIERIALVQEPPEAGWGVSRFPRWIAGPRSATINGLNFEITDVVEWRTGNPAGYWRFIRAFRESTFIGYRRFTYDRPLTQAQEHITDVGLVLVRRANGNIYIAVSYSMIFHPHPSLGMAPREVNNVFLTSQRIDLQPILPAPEPIFLSPLNILDSPTTIIDQIRNRPGIECDNCTVLIWLPDDPTDLRDRPIDEIIITRPDDSGNDNENDNDYCPYDPTNQCQCEPLDEYGFFNRFWARFYEAFVGVVNDDGTVDGGWFAPIINLISSLFNNMTNIITTLLERVLSLLDTLLGGILSLLENALGLLRYVLDFLGRVVEILGNLLETLIDGLLGMVLGIFESIAFADFNFDFSPLLERVPNFMEFFPFSLPMALYNTFRVTTGQAPINVIGMTLEESNAYIASFSYAGVTPHFSLEAPRIVMDIPAPFNYEFVFDMNEYPLFIALVRWSTLAIFAIGMMKMTSKIIRW